MTAVELVTLIGAVTAALVALMGAALQFYVAVQAAKTHTLVNGLSTTLMGSARLAGQAEGRLAESKGTDTPPTSPVLPPEVS